MKKFICRNCGVVNEASEDSLESKSDWLTCTLPEGFEWILPAGKITPVTGDPIYISGIGDHLSYEAYFNKHGIDPEIAYRLMRGKSGYQSASGSSAGQPQMENQIRSKGRAQNWLDEDDWTS